MKPVSNIFKFAEKQRPKTSMTPDEMREYKRRWFKANKDIVSAREKASHKERYQAKKEWLERLKKVPAKYAEYLAKERARYHRRKKTKKTP